MSLYIPATETRGRWSEEVEGSWQGLGTGSILSKVSHLSLSDELFIGAVAANPREQRPWGAISWVAEVFGISRPTVYALGERIVERLRYRVSGEGQGASIRVAGDKTSERLNWLALLGFPAS